MRSSHRLFRWSFVPLALVYLATSSCADSTGPADTPDDPDDPDDPTALVVSSVAPADGAAAVSATSSVSVVFSRAIDPISVTTSTFRVGTVAGAVAGTVSASGATATFTPDEPFAGGSTQTVTVTGVVDPEGLPMGGAFTSAFTVAEPPPMAPEAHAGDDQLVSFGAAVTLDASGSAGTNKTYVWTQLAGPDVGALSGASPMFTAPDDITLLRFDVAVSGDGPVSHDEVAVMVLEDGAHAYFVAPTGSDAAAGTREAPFQTVQHAIEVADAAGNGGDVYVAAGTYGETLTLRSRVSVYGGFDATTWQRDLITRRPSIESAEDIAVSGTEANLLTVEGFRISAANATTASRSSIGLFLRNSADVRLRRNVIVTGDGFPGSDGADGANRGGASDGGDGTNAGVCPPSRTGGGGGTSSFDRNGGGGGTGGLGGGFGGGDGQGTSGGNGGSAGGAFGGNGSNGSVSTAARAAGAGGAGGSAFGALTATEISVTVASTGGSGQNGWGGGGGGGGGGGFGCGGGGGGGGAGGQGGGPGAGGARGGHSIGIALSGTTTATITESEFLLGNGGVGGRGGNGGTRGSGGSGGSGGSNNASGGSGGDGASGTSGAHGGGGGGGMGGSVIAVLEDADATSLREALVFTPGTAGAGGAGGPRSGGHAGGAGSAGEVTLVKKLP